VLLDSLFSGSYNFGCAEVEAKDPNNPRPSSTVGLCYRGRFRAAIRKENRRTQDAAKVTSLPGIGSYNVRVIGFTGSLGEK